jgi:hypothetical protein
VSKLKIDSKYSNLFILFNGLVDDYPVEAMPSEIG